jgi:hypothetical protein
LCVLKTKLDKRIFDKKLRVWCFQNYQCVSVFMIVL